MVRKNIFELLLDKYDVNEEINKIRELFENAVIYYTNPRDYGEQTKLSIEAVVDNFLLVGWKQRKGCLSCSEIRTKLQLDSFFYNSVEDIVCILEYMSNLICLIDKVIFLRNNTLFQFDTNFSFLKQNIDLLLEHINYEKHIFDNEQKVILVPKNPAATTVAEISSQETAMAILKYHHTSLKGELEEKRKILLSIAHEYETLLSNGIDGFNDYFSKAREMLNNLDIRHNNKDGKHKKDFVVNMSSEELEKWYDELYQLLLFCVLIKDNKYRKDEISKFLEQLNKKSEDLKQS